jgi:hypothetical protein
MAVPSNRDIADGMGVKVFDRKRGYENRQVKEHQKEKIAVFPNHSFSHFVCKDIPLAGQNTN